MNKVYKEYIDIALSDFILGYESEKISNVDDIYMFANYMHGFYPKIPYFEVANMIALKIIENKKQKSLSYEKIFVSQNFGLKKVLSGHFMEIINYSISNNDVPKKITLSKK